MWRQYIVYPGRINGSCKPQLLQTLLPSSQITIAPGTRVTTNAHAQPHP